MKNIKKYLLIGTFCGFSTIVTAEPLLATMETNAASITITFTDFAQVEGFEKYECKVDMGNWVYSLPAKKITLNDQTVYQCQDQGGLQLNTLYDVWFSFEDRPYGRVSNSPVFKLSAE